MVMSTTPQRTIDRTGSYRTGPYRTGPYRAGSERVENAPTARPGLGLGLAVGVVVARLASVVAGAATVLTAQWLLVVLAALAVAMGRSEQRAARSGSEQRLARLARRVGGMQLAIGVVLLVVTAQAPHLVKGATDWISG